MYASVDTWNVSSSGRRSFARNHTTCCEGVYGFFSYRSPGTTRMSQSDHSSNSRRRARGIVEVSTTTSSGSGTTRIVSECSMPVSPRTWKLDCIMKIVRPSWMARTCRWQNDRPSRIRSTM